jgi:hypothetical protein
LKLRTLQVARPFGKTIWLSFAFLLLILGFAEWVARSDLIQSLLTPPKMGSRHYQLGNKLALLNSAIQKHGPVDCLFIGSSMVDLGIDPEAFRESYREKTGRDIRCFNFAIDASSATSSAALAQILVEDYKPHLLIFGTDARDYAVFRDDQDAAVILDTNWIKYRMGHFSLDGWLTEHSFLYRYRQHLSQLMRFDLDGTIRSETTENFGIQPNGFTPNKEIGTYINDPPDPADDSFEVTYNTKIFSSYRMLEDNLAALEQILNQNKAETVVVVAEMVIADGLYYFFGNGQSDHQLFIDRIRDISAAHGVPFLEAERLDLIPDDGWVDYSHLNAKGAKVFSAWLGGQIGEMEINKSLP